MRVIVLAKERGWQGGILSPLAPRDVFPLGQYLSFRVLSLGFCILGVIGRQAPYCRLQGGILSFLYWERCIFSPSSFLHFLFFFQSFNLVPQIVCFFLSSLLCFLLLAFSGVIFPLIVGRRFHFLSGLFLSLCFLPFSCAAGTEDVFHPPQYLLFVLNLLFFKSFLPLSYTAD